jgi:hypothetical protein
MQSSPDDGASPPAEAYVATAALQRSNATSLRREASLHLAIGAPGSRGRARELLRERLSAFKRARVAEERAAELRSMSDLVSGAQGAEVADTGRLSSLRSLARKVYEGEMGTKRQAYEKDEETQKQVTVDGSPEEDVNAQLSALSIRATEGKGRSSEGAPAEAAGVSQCTNDVASAAGGRAGVLRWQNMFCSGDRPAAQLIYQAGPATGGATKSSTVNNNKAEPSCALVASGPPMISDTNEVDNRDHGYSKCIYNLSVT